MRASGKPRVSVVIPAVNCVLKSATDVMDASVGVHTSLAPIRITIS
jgi:hypothetical protein